MYYNVRVASLRYAALKYIEKENIMDDIQVNDERFKEAYDFLVDETENPDTIYDRRRHDRLSDLLQLFEYLLNEDEENPLILWFPVE